MFDPPRKGSRGFKMMVEQATRTLTADYGERH